VDRSSVCWERIGWKPPITNYGNSDLERRISIRRPRREHLPFCIQTPASPLILPCHFALTPHPYPSGRSVFSLDESFPATICFLPSPSSIVADSPPGSHALQRPPVVADASRPDSDASTPGACRSIPNAPRRPPLTRASRRPSSMHARHRCPLFRTGSSTA
jgi:hypothetical protein